MARLDARSTVATSAGAIPFSDLIERVVGGEVAAWHELWQRIEPLVWGISGKWQVTGPLCRSTDDRREIVLRVMERLRDAGFHRLRLFRASQGGDAAFRAWLCTLAARVAIDHVRAHPEHVDPRGRRGEGRWARWVELEDVAEPAAGLDPSGRATALRLLDRARAELTAEQLTALYAWLDGADNQAIASKLGLDDAQAAFRVVRSALKRLRDRYRDQHLAGAREAEDAT